MQADIRAPVPNKPTASVDVKQHFHIKKNCEAVQTPLMLLLQELQWRNDGGWKKASFFFFFCSLEDRD